MKHFIASVWLLITLLVLQGVALAAGSCTGWTQVRKDVYTSYVRWETTCTADGSGVFNPATLLYLDQSGVLTSISVGFGSPAPNALTVTPKHKLKAGTVPFLLSALSWTSSYEQQVISSGPLMPAADGTYFDIGGNTTAGAVVDIGVTMILP